MTKARDSEVCRERSQGRRGRAAGRKRAPKKEDHLGEQLAGYAFAAGAALVAGPASAEIIYSGTQNILLNEGGSVSIDLDGGGNDFTFVFNRATVSTIIDRRVLLEQAGTAVNSAIASPPLLPSKLAASSPIGAAAAGWSGGAGKEFVLGRFASYDGLNYGLSGNFVTFKAAFGSGNTGFAEGSSGYLGVRFKTTGDTTLYGWIQVAVGDLGAGRTNTATIIDWAYEDSGASILAGQVVVPEPSGLAALAAGAAGLVAWRRLKRKRGAAEGPREG